MADRIKKPQTISFDYLSLYLALLPRYFEGVRVFTKETNFFVSLCCMPSPEAPVGNVQVHITIRAVGSGVLPTDLPQMPMAHLMLSGTLVTRVPLLLQSPLLQQVGALGSSWSWLCTQSTPEGLGWATPNTLWVSCLRHDGWLRS